MNETNLLPSSTTAGQPWRWPTAGEIGFICLRVVMPYVLAGVLLAA